MLHVHSCLKKGTQQLVYLTYYAEKTKESRCPHINEHLVNNVHLAPDAGAALHVVTNGVHVVQRDQQDVLGSQR